jgi:hypothetical protein
MGTTGHGERRVDGKPVVARAFGGAPNGASRAAAFSGFNRHDPSMQADRLQLGVGQGDKLAVEMARVRDHIVPRLQ